MKKGKSAMCHIISVYDKRWEMYDDMWLYYNGGIIDGVCEMNGMSIIDKYSYYDIEMNYDDTCFRLKTKRK